MFENSEIQKYTDLLTVNIQLSINDMDLRILLICLILNQPMESETHEIMTYQQYCVMHHTHYQTSMQECSKLANQK